MKGKQGSMSWSNFIITLPKLEMLNQEISPVEDFMFFPSIEDNIVINTIEQSVGVGNQAINHLSSLTVFYDTSTNAPPPSLSSTIETQCNGNYF